MGHFLPGETLPVGETDGDGWVEVAAGGGCAGDDCKGDADGETPADLKKAAECGGAVGLFGVEGEGGDCGDAGEYVEEYARGFGHAFAEDAGSGLPSLLNFSGGVVDRERGKKGRPRLFQGEK